MYRTYSHTCIRTYRVCARGSLYGVDLRTCTRTHPARTRVDDSWYEYYSLRSPDHQIGLACTWPAELGHGMGYMYSTWSGYRVPVCACTLDPLGGSLAREPQNTNRKKVLLFLSMLIIRTSYASYSILREKTWLLCACRRHRRGIQERWEDRSEFCHSKTKRKTISSVSSCMERSGLPYSSTTLLFLILV